MFFVMHCLHQIIDHFCYLTWEAPLQTFLFTIEAKLNLSAMPETKLRSAELILKKTEDILNKGRLKVNSFH